MLTATRKPAAQNRGRADRSPERARQDYVKAIYQLGNDAPVSAAALARYLGVSRAAVTKSRRLWENEGLVERAESRADRLQLTRRGRGLALRMLRRHRLIETFLHRTLGVPLDDLHALAEAIEHAISDDVAERLASFLGHPDFDPHGHPIATTRKGITRFARRPLAEVALGTRVIIESIPDRDPAIVRRLSAQHALPGLDALVVGSDKNGVRLRSTRGLHTIGPSVAKLVMVAER